jgi:deoxyribose-phosphate aldolase
MTDGMTDSSLQHEADAEPADLTNLASFIDHTLLKPEASSADIAKLCEEAMEYRFYSVCVNSAWVSYCRSLLTGSGVRISAVCGFPLGAAAGPVKAYEAAYAVEQGAEEIDMVLPVGPLIAGDERAVYNDIRAVAEAIQGAARLKVILETGLLTDAQKVTGCRIAEQAGAHFVKTSTGFGPGRATEADVRLMRGAVSGHVGVKASGGIRGREAALAMIRAGAARIGTSSGVAIMNGSGATPANNIAEAPPRNRRY